MARSRNHRRSKAGEFKVYDGNTVDGWRIVHRTSFEKGEMLVSSSRARRVADMNGQHIGYLAGTFSRDVAQKTLKVDEIIAVNRMAGKQHAL